MALILAIETDPRQASVLKRVVREHVGAFLVVVNSKDAAIAAIDGEAPDLILLSTLLSPREEEEVVAHLRGLDRADHLQTLTIPLLARTADEDEASSGGLLAAFRRRRTASRPAGCDPNQFAEEIRGYLQRAEEIKAERAALEEAAGARSARMFTAEIAERLTAEVTETTKSLAAEVTENTEPFTAEVTESAEAFVTKTQQNTETIAVGASFAAPSRRQAPLAMWAKSEAADTAPAVLVSQTIGDEIRVLLRSLRLPAQLADLSSPCGCWIRQVRVVRPRVRGRSALVGA